MTYTLAMAAEQGISIADDGVAGPPFPIDRPECFSFGIGKAHGESHYFLALLLNSCPGKFEDGWALPERGEVHRDQ